MAKERGWWELKTTTEPSPTDIEEMEKLERDIQAEKWHAFQNFQSFLSLEEMKQIRRHLIAIEKGLFAKPCETCGETGGKHSDDACEPYKGGGEK